MYFNNVNPGDRVRLDARDGQGPSIEGTVTVATPNYVVIRGCGFTQFQAQQYTLNPIATPDKPAPTKGPGELARDTLQELLQDTDPSIRLSAARELISDDMRF
jgi:hypothetical protein